MSKLGENIAFIIGSPRSGTTWLQKILGSHESIVTAQESEFFVSFALPWIRSFENQLNNPSGRGGTGLPCYLTENQFEAIIRNTFYQIIAEVRAYSEERIFVEKTPSHALVVDIIHRILPRAKFIHIVRDPRDVAASMIAASKSWGKNWAPGNTFTAARMWSQHVRTAREQLVEISKEQIYWLRYEDLKISTAKVIEEILNFIGLETASNIIDSIIQGSQRFKLREIWRIWKHFLEKL